MGKREAFPTYTTLGDGIIFTFAEEKEDHSNLQQQIREQEMTELMTAVNDGRVYRPNRDASPELKKMRDILKLKGNKLRKMRHVADVARRF